MEEKILTSLNEINKRLTQIDQRLDGVDQRLDKVDQRLDKVDQRLDHVDQRLDKMDLKFDEVKEELRNEFKQENAKLKEDLRAEMDENNTSLKGELKKELLDYMFVFEENYGRKINIMYEELTAKMQKDRNSEENILILEKRIDKNSAFIFSHENRITALERREG